MDPTENVFPIQDLPDEVLEQVLSCLGLKHQKSASLVCRRWSRLAIPAAGVVLVVDSSRDTIENYLQFLMTSERCYKHLRIAAFPNSNMEVAAEVLINKFRRTLLSLELDKLSSVAHIWRLCTRIQCLNIIKCFGDPEIDEELVLAPLPHLKTSVKFFQLRGIDVCQLAPNISALSVDLPEGSTLYDIPKSVLDYFAPRLTQLQFSELRFEAGIEFELYISNFLTRCENLQFISLGKHNFLCSKFFRHLAQSCTNLRELSFDKVHLDQETFQQLCSLQQLKRLHIFHTSVEVLDSDFTSSDLRELVLESADVQDIPSFNVSLETAFPKLVVLHLKYKAEEPLRLSNFKHLKSVHLEHANFGLNSDMLDEFASLHQLRSVSVRSLNFNVDKLQTKPDLSHIKRLHIWTQLDDDRLKLLTRLFPSLTSLQLCGRLKCTAAGLRTAKQALPASCEVQLLADGELLPRRGLQVEREWCCQWRNGLKGDGCQW